MINITDKSEFLINELNGKNIVIFVGSAVSMYPPTCLFSDTQFVEEIFASLFPKKFIDSINFNEQKILKKLFNNIPFEHLLERFPDREKLIQVLKNAYHINKFNPLHQILAYLLHEGKIKAIITTNYDLCLDEALNKCNFEFLRIVTKNDFETNNRNIKSKRTYFKIHGSADDIKGETLVLTLTQESILPKWKRKVLYQLLENKVLVITGYSGKDFEICPELEQMPFEQIIWNTNSEKLPSKNAGRILTQRNGTQLIEDMKELLCGLFDHKLSHNLSYLKPNPRKDMLDKISCGIIKNETEIEEWRASLLNSTGIPSLALKASNELLKSITTKKSEQFISALRQEAQALFHIGKYKYSAILFHKALLVAKNLNNKYLEADLLLDESESLRCYGSFFRSIHNIKLASRISKDIRIKKERDRLLGKIFLRKALLLEPFYQKFIRIKLSFFSQRINKKMPEYLQKACSLSLESGNWFDFYQTKLLTDRIKVPINISHINNYYEPPPSKEAYMQLCYYIPLSINFRNQLKQNKGLLTNDEEKSVNYFLETNKSVKNVPEIWKTVWICIKRDRRWLRNTEALRDFFWSFFSCQYTIKMRIFKLIFT